jgi:hypothetical protein
MWIPIKELGTYDVRPASLAKALISGEIEEWQGWKIGEE